MDPARPLTGLHRRFLVLCAVAIPALPARAADATLAGEASAPYPTIVNLSLDWKIAGDDNLNGVVRVYYRQAGASSWREGLPLRRVPADSSGNRTTPRFDWENKHSGSIFDLRPDTEYEIRLELQDPDGGSARRLLRARTRPIPRPAPGSPLRKANPRNFQEAAAALAPGEILELSPGYYESFTAPRDGEPGRPIVIRGAAGMPLASVFDGVSLEGRRHVILEQLTVNGSVNLQGGEDLAVRRCQVNAKFGIIAKRKPGARNCYIADNTVTYVMPWIPEGMGSGSVYGGPACVGEGIEITGPGNVICHNRVKGYRDCISTMEDRNVEEQVSIDIYNNDVYLGADDGIEADFSMGNCRIIRNRLTNCFMGLSSQPSLGGPTYFIRNVMYNLIEAPFKLERWSVGNVFLHNTVVKVGDGYRAPHGPGSYARSLFRNNLAIGGVGGGRFGRYSSGTGRAMYLPETDPTNDFDYDGVGTHGTPFQGRIGRAVFSSLEDLRRNTTEKHAVQVDLGVFLKLDFPHPAVPERLPADLRLKPGSPAVDAGARLPNINDNYRGAAPDLGALELEEPLPHYGPRPEGVDEESEWRARQSGAAKP